MRGNKSEDEHDSSDQEMLDLVDDPSFQQSIKDASMKSGASSKRGRPKIPLKWSRIIDVDAADGARLVGFNIDEDFESLEEELKQQTKLLSEHVNAGPKSPLSQIPRDGSTE